MRSWTTDVPDPWAAGMQSGVFLEQGAVPILLSISQMRNLYMTIKHTPQCDKITCKAFGMNRQAVPVSGAGHAPVDLAGVARVKAHSGLKVGTPVDIRAGFHVMTSKGRHMVMEIIKEQAPDVILMAPVCGPLSNTQNIQQDQQRVWEKRKRYLPMVEFVASIARYQLKHGRYFIIENPQTSKIWLCSNCFQIHP